MTGASDTGIVAFRIALSLALFIESDDRRAKLNANSAPTCDMFQYLEAR
jgi:hypothetical protein